jgi:hypothetical protein
VRARVITVSSASASLCVAGGWDGYGETFSGSGWTTPTELAGGGSLLDVSCALGTTLCAISEFDELLTANGSMTADPPDPPDPPDAAEMIELPSGLSRGCLATA